MALEKEVSPDFTDKKNKDISNPQKFDRNADIEGARSNRSRFGSSNRAVGARIAPVLPHLKGYDFGSDDSGSDLLGKQIELEADNAIQYRTCSWQKVCLCPGPPRRYICQCHILMADMEIRPQRCFSLNIFVWLSCHSPIHILFWVWSQVSF
jgi:hypothetical protein